MLANGNGVGPIYCITTALACSTFVVPNLGHPSYTEPDYSKSNLGATLLLDPNWRIEFFSAHNNYVPVES